MSRDWTFFLEDIQESCARVLRYTQGMTSEQFRADDKTYDAVVRNLEVIGEAAKGLPDDVRAMMPDIEWNKATGLRNIVAHAYFGINNEILWDVVQNARGEPPGASGASTRSAPVADCVKTLCAPPL
jgi:uncharacterized protein with HEPN domain